MSQSWILCKVGKRTYLVSGISDIKSAGMPARTLGDFEAYEECGVRNQGCERAMKGVCGCSALLTR